MCIFVYSLNINTIVGITQVKESRLNTKFHFKSSYLRNCKYASFIVKQITNLANSG